MPILTVHATQWLRMRDHVLSKDTMRRLAFVVLPEFSHLGLAAAIEPLFVANWLAERTMFDWTIVSIDGAPVRASNAMAITVDGDLAAAAGCDAVFVLASFDPQRVVRVPALLAWLRRTARAGIEIGGIENGSLVLAEAGLLDGLDVAVHWDNVIGFQERYPAVRAVDRLYVRSGRRITCAGAAAILDMMIAWIGGSESPGLAAEIAEHLLLAAPRSADAPQRPLPTLAAVAPDPLVIAAQALMRSHLEEPLPCSDIAAHVGLSLRQIERRFRLQLGRSVVQEYMTLRLARAHQLLQQTELSVMDVSVACGFTSPTYFSRLYRRTFGCSPTSDRRQLATAPVFRRSRVQ